MHPLRIGLASCAGVKLGAATIGVAKSVLTGEVIADVGEPGAVASVRDGDELLEYAFGPPTGEPPYLSAGHRVPEPLRLAHTKAGCARDA